MSLIVEVRVVPSAGKNRWDLDTAGRLKCYLKSPAERGKANQELVETLAKALHIPKHHVEIITGLTSRTKRIKIHVKLTFEQLLSFLALERQLSCIK